jgi:hypothetical protein
MLISSTLAIKSRWPALTHLHLEVYGALADWESYRVLPSAFAPKTLESFTIYHQTLSPRVQQNEVLLQDVGRFMGLRVLGIDGGTAIAVVDDVLVSALQRCPRLNTLRLAPNAELYDLSRGAVTLDILERLACHCPDLESLSGCFNLEQSTMLRNSSRMCNNLQEVHLNRSYFTSAEKPENWQETVVHYLMSFTQGVCNLSISRQTCRPLTEDEDWEDNGVHRGESITVFASRAEAANAIRVRAESPWVDN